MTNIKKINTTIDLFFFLSLFSLIPLISYIHWAIAVYFTILLSAGFALYQHLKEKNFYNNRKETIEATIREFIKNRDYDLLKEINYKFPIATLYCLTHFLSKEEILNLDFNELKYKEYRPDKKIIEHLLNFLDKNDPTFAELDSDFFLADFLHYYSDVKN